MPPNYRVREQDLPPYNPDAGPTDPSGPRPPGYGDPDGPRPPSQNPPGNSNQKPPQSDWDNMKDGFKWMMEQHKDWKKALDQLIAQGNVGAKQLKQVLEKLESGDIAGAMNDAKQFYSTIMAAKVQLEKVLMNPVGAGVDVGMDILGVLLQMDPAKRAEGAKQLLMKWFPWFDWDAPPAIWLTADKKAVNRDNSNTDYAGRPLPGYYDPFTISKNVNAWSIPGGR